MTTVGKNNTTDPTADLLAEMAIARRNVSGVLASIEEERRSVENAKSALDAHEKYLAALQKEHEKQARHYNELVNKFRGTVKEINVVSTKGPEMSDDVVMNHLIVCYKKAKDGKKMHIFFVIPNTPEDTTFNPDACFLTKSEFVSAMAVFKKCGARISSASMKDANLPRLTMEDESEVKCFILDITDILFKDAKGNFIISSIHFAPTDRNPATAFTTEDRKAIRELIQSS